MRTIPQRRLHGAAAVLVLASLLPGADELASLERWYREARDSAGRIQALEAIAASYDAARADAEAVTNAVAAGLHAEELPVRTRAVELLGEGLHPEASLVALVAAASGFEEAARVNAARIRAVMEPHRGGTADEVSGERIVGVLLASKEATRLREELEGYRLALVRSLSASADPRATDGLAELLRSTGPGPRADTVLDELLRRGTRASLGHVVSAVERYDERLDDASRRVKEKKRQRPGPIPDFWKGSKKQWKEREEARLEAEVAEAEGERAELEAWGETLRARLARFAEEHELPRTPGSLDSPRAWSSWLDRAGKVLP